ncbi:lysozyme inhibitor LprI family protein [Ralstonia sp. GX3-BWBA]|uniref:lysozyme inhibitor LprI family protein n=1 Tax=Ralstonia sp. GX3-BWBA TaxID=2219865 RepID=UPI001EF9AFE6|nr:lysozyme inhibitor LprI family protein [Ralstonia sp. GX3-BWBA]
MIRAPLLLTASLLAWGGVAYASTDCGNPVTSADVAQCADRESLVIERKLGAVYSQVLIGLRKVDKEYSHSYPNRPPLHAAESFAAAQRAWLNFRRQSCHVEELVVRNGNPSRGDQPGIAVAACESRLSSARVAELENLVTTYDISASKDYRQ